MVSTPNWIQKTERYLGWIALPQIGILLITLQALGFLMVSYDPSWLLRLSLIPSAVWAGEVWRLVTFLSLPLSHSFFWVLFVLWFLYFILQSLENEWGSYKTTLYVLISVFLMIGFSLAFDYPIQQIRHFESTLFLAAALLFPEFTVMLFFVLPVKMKWLALLSSVFILIELIQGTWMDRFFLLVIYSNFILFFGPSLLNQIRFWVRRKSFLKRR